MLIYEPSGRALEYAPLACNIYSGCDHRCVYCYAPSVLQKSRNDFAKPSLRPVNFIHILDREASKLTAAGDTRPVLLSFTCDPYQAFDVKEHLTRDTIKTLHQHGRAVHVLTKGGKRALRDIDLFMPTDAFATTMTLLSDNGSLKWEPGAALPSDRIYTLQIFHAAGIPTWVSLEPVLNPDCALEIIRRTHKFVDLYKVGKLNYHPLANAIDWHKFASDIVMLLESLDKPHYIKQDLAAYLNH